MLADMRTRLWKRPSGPRRVARGLDPADMGTVFGLEASLAEHAGERLSTIAMSMSMPTPLTRRRSWWRRLAARGRR